MAIKNVLPSMIVTIAAIAFVRPASLNIGIFDSEGTKPSEVVGRLRSLGFALIKGEQDMVYNWPDSATADEESSRILCT